MEPLDERYLLCVYPEHTCEKTVVKNEAGWGEVKIAVYEGFLAMLIATPLQFIWDIACVYLVKVKHNQDKASESCKMLSFQILLTLIYLYLLVQVVHDINEILNHGRPGLFFTTMFYALILDQVKSVGTLSLVYCIVVRRFMHLEINENEYQDPNAEKIPKQENAIPRLKLWFLKLLESGPVEGFAMFVIGVYTVFTLFWLTHSGFLREGVEPIDNRILGEIDGFFLWFFLVEIFLKSFASSLQYLKDPPAFMDFIIVVLSVVLNLNKYYQPGLGALRLVRVVVIIVRKISGGGNKLRHQNKLNNPI